MTKNKKQFGIMENPQYNTEEFVDAILTILCRAKTLNRTYKLAGMLYTIYEKGYFPCEYIQNKNNTWEHTRPILSEILPEITDREINHHILILNNQNICRGNNEKN